MRENHSLTVSIFFTLTVAFLQKGKPVPGDSKNNDGDDADGEW